jgi:hypothetical protein
LHPSIEKPMLDEQGEPPPDRNPSCVAAEESGRRLARAVLETMDAIKLDGVFYPLEQPAALIGALNSPHDKSADKRQSLETKPISRGTESSNPPPSSRESGELYRHFGGNGAIPSRSRSSPGAGGSL